MRILHIIDVFLVTKNLNISQIQILTVFFVAHFVVLVPAAS